MFCITRYLRYTCRGDLVVIVYEVNNGIACVFLEYLGLSAIGKKSPVRSFYSCLISWIYMVLSNGSLTACLSFSLCETQKT